MKQHLPLPLPPPPSSQYKFTAMGLQRKEGKQIHYQVERFLNTDRVDKS